MAWPQAGPPVLAGPLLLWLAEEAAAAGKAKTDEKPVEIIKLFSPKPKWLTIF